MHRCIQPNGHDKHAVSYKITMQKMKYIFLQILFFDTFYNIEIKW